MNWTGQPGWPARRACVAWLAALFLLLPGQAALSQSEHDLPLVLSASSGGRDGFVRIINRSDQPGEVDIEAIDDSGQRFGPVSLSLDANGATQFNSRDLEEGSSHVGLSAGVGDGTGDWRLELRTTLDIEPLAYVRTADGFLTSMHDLASEETPMRYRVPIFNPGSNQSLVSSLRLINPGDDAAEVVISAVDARGNPAPGGDARLSLPAGTARTLTAQHLEEGTSELTGGLGDGEGKWQLSVTSSVPLRVLSLMQTRSGHLTNLSQGVASDTTTIPLVLPASDVGPQGFVRIINRSDEAGEVSIEAIDDTGRSFGPVSLSLDAKGAAQFNSGDLEQGNPGVGLSMGVGDGTGNWRLELDTTLDIEPLAYVRTADGFLTSMHGVASEESPLHYRVPIFNPGSNRSLVSSLRLINPGDGVADITISGVDARGNPAPSGDASLSLAAGTSRTLTAQHLEEGTSELTGRLGDGEGKWQLSVASDTPLQVMNLMQTRSGHLTNLSTTSQRPPPLDHSDTPEDATDITNLESIQGTIDSPDDVDYFTFTLDEPTEVMIELLVETELQDEVVELTLLDSEGNIVDEARTDDAVTAPRSEVGGDSNAAVSRVAVAPKPGPGGVLAVGGALLAGIYRLALVINSVPEGKSVVYKLVKIVFGIDAARCPRVIEGQQLQITVQAGGQAEVIRLTDYIENPDGTPLSFGIALPRPKDLDITLHDSTVTVAAPADVQSRQHILRIIARQQPFYQRCPVDPTVFEFTVVVNGFAPANQTKFGDRFRGKRVRITITYSLSIISHSRFREDSGLATYFGSYTYRNTGVHSGTLILRYDDGDRCTLSIKFEDFFSGTVKSSCLPSSVTLDWTAR